MFLRPRDRVVIRHHPQGALPLVRQETFPRRRAQALGIRGPPNDLNRRMLKLEGHERRDILDNDTERPRKTQKRGGKYKKSKRSRKTRKSRKYKK